MHISGCHRVQEPVGNNVFHPELPIFYIALDGVLHSFGLEKIRHFNMCPSGWQDLSTFKIHMWGKYLLH